LKRKVIHGIYYNQKGKRSTPYMYLYHRGTMIFNDTQKINDSLPTLQRNDLKNFLIPSHGFKNKRLKRGILCVLKAFKKTDTWYPSFLEPVKEKIRMRATPSIIGLSYHSFFLDRTLPLRMKGGIQKRKTSFLF
jgi:hypothetical protein